MSGNAVSLELVHDYISRGCDILSSDELNQCGGALARIGSYFLVRSADAVQFEKALHFVVGDPVVQLRDKDKVILGRRPCAPTGRVCLSMKMKMRDWKTGFGVCLEKRG
jgi:hypothetical protein